MIFLCVKMSCVTWILVFACATLLAGKRHSLVLNHIILRFALLKNIFLRRMCLVAPLAILKRGCGALQIDLTFTEACHLRHIVNDRQQYLGRKLSKLRRYHDSRGDRVVFQEQIALIQGEILDLGHVDKELIRVITHSLLLSEMRNEFGIVQKNDF